MRPPGQVLPGIGRGSRTGVVRPPPMRARAPNDGAGNVGWIGARFWAHG
jgi:hypothetical protein